MAMAAIHNGANAIYVGMPGFNARGRSHDHSIEELKEIIEICHLYDVHVHVAFNILIFQDELEAAARALIDVLELYPDALIVQDLGLVRIIKQIAPNQVVHGSTQMTVTNHEAIELLDDLDIDRFVLGRENTLSEIETIKGKTKKELEVFVHGALCVAYSGQCFTSEVLGGRSANRGQCAQSCRLDYELYVDGEKKDLIDQKYLVSPKDLCGIEEVPKLMELGVDSFKVEGRLKGPEYVASVANNYRQVMDKNSSFDKESALEEMELVYSRGFYSGWLNGVAHQELVDGTFSNKRGREIGTVLNIEDRWVEVKTKSELIAGDGLFFADHQSQIGGSVYHVEKSKQGLRVSFAKDFDLSQVHSGQKVYLSFRDKLNKELNKTYTQKEKLKRLPLSIVATGSIGTELEITATVGNHVVILSTTNKLEAAQSRPLTSEAIKDSLSGLSHTPYKVTEFNSEITDKVFIHNKEIKKLKQAMVAELNNERLQREDLVSGDFEMPAEVQPNNASDSKLSLVLRTLQQVKAVLKYLDENQQLKRYLARIVVDFEFGKDFTPAIKMIKEASIESVIATTRILKPGEYHNFRLIERANPDSLLIRNLGALNYFKDSDFNLYGDFSLNVTNHLTHGYLINKGLKTVCASYDMNTNQLDELIKYIEPSTLEVTVHQYMPEFHMEHCVFAAFMSKGNSFRDCGKPCEKHTVHLKDMYGNQHEIKADQECRNTMFSSIPQSAATFIEDWKQKGIKTFRLEALHESNEEITTKVSTYLQLLANEITANDAYQKMGTMERYGVSTGTLLNTHTYKDRKKSNLER
jgi:putative protease